MTRKKNEVPGPSLPFPFGLLRVFFKKPAALAALTGLLLALSFPGFHFGFLAWIALVPFFAALEKADSLSSALKLGFTAGMVFFSFSLSWITYVTGFGWIALALLETAFFAGFSAFAYFTREERIPVLRILAAAAAWTSWEWFRAEIPVFGFGWNLLAYSQSGYLWVRMAANTVGAYGLGFVMAAANACVFEIIRSDKKEKKSSAPAILLPVMLVLLLAHGIYYGARKGENPDSVRISVLQGNIPQSIKWEPVAREKILQIYEKLAEISSFDAPELMIWPEASYPGYFNRDAESRRIQELVRKFGVPALVGSPHLETDEIAFNSAYLLDADGEVRQRYDKQYLVPFGEYVPLGPALGWLKPLAYTLGVSDFTPGRDWTVFKIMNGDVSFSTLICFEDIFPALARTFTDRGAQFLAVITNDAWFGPTAAPYQHEQASIFRAVENGVPVVRSANTGVSSFISSKGRVLARVSSSEGKEIFVTAKKTWDLPLENFQTAYRRGGWIFPYGALLLSLIIIVRVKAESVRRASR